MIQISNLNKWFGKLHALCDVNVALQQGECVAFVGPNGCGKSTLMKCILGLVTPSSGTITIDGRRVDQDIAVRELVGFMPQKPVFPPNMTVRQAIETIKRVRCYQGELDEELMRDFDIEGMMNKRTGTLSGGTAQKLNAAIAFMFNPRILVLDEPMASLDPMAAEVLKTKIIKSRQQGCLILISSHILSELEGVASHVVCIDNGKVTLHKSVAELVQDSSGSDLRTAVLEIITHNDTNQAVKDE